MVGWGSITSPGLAAAIIRDQRKKRTAAASYLNCSSKQLPDDIITEILSRLSAHQIMELRYVCKHWLALTSTQSFRELHFMNQSPMDLFVAQYTSYATDLSVSPLLTNSFEFLAISENPTDSKYRFKRSKIGITVCTSTPLQLCKPLLISSYRGFLLFRHYSNEDLVLCFYNPMTREQVTVAAPASRYVYCGFYFHSPTKEFRVLYQVLIDHDDEQDAGLNGFAILGLRTKSLRRIKNFPHCPSSSAESAPPIILNGALYWIVSETHVHGHPSCSETILSFGTESEEFQVMPHPGDKCVVSSGGGGVEGGHDSHDTYYMNLMDMDGQLCLRVVSDPYKLLEIWILEDYKEWIWVKIQVKFELLKLLFDNFDVGLPGTRNVLCMHNSELMIDYVKMKKYYKRYSCFLYNLKDDHLRELETTCLERGKKFGNMMAAHPSLLSLHNEKFGYVLYLHDDQSVEERRDLDKVCQVVETCRKQNSLSIIKQLGILLVLVLVLVLVLE